MTDVDKFREFLSKIEKVLGDIGGVVDLEIGVPGELTPWMFEGARAIQNIDERAPLANLRPGDVQIRFDYSSPQIRTMIGRVVVDIVPRFGLRSRW